MYSPRSILVLLVLAQIVGAAVVALANALQTVLLVPLMHVFSDELIGMRVGGFDMSGVLLAILICVFSIVVGVVILGVTVKVSWKWLERLLPVQQNSKPPTQP